MNEYSQKNQERKKLLSVLAITTLLFFAVLGGLLLLHSRLPAIRENRIIHSLEQGNLQAARELAGRLDDEDKRSAYLTECDYREAVSLMREEHWEEAAALLTAAAGYADAAELKKECDYRLAISFAEAERWDEAEKRFLTLGSYKDAGEKLLLCRFHRAQALQADGQFVEAAAIYQMLGDYGDAGKCLYTMAQDATGIADPDLAVAVLLGQTPEAAARLADLKARREALPRGIIDVGFSHTVGLSSDGSALACGDDSFGQCRVDGYQDLCAVAAGAYHTLLLHSDGTVTAVGRNSEGQCDTGAWRDVVQIAAADYASFGLCRDGTVLFTGFNNYDRCAAWTGVTAIAGGSYNIAGLRVDGGAWIYPGIDGVDEMQGLVELVINTGFCFGLTADGSLVGTAEQPEGWSDLLCLSASGTRLLGLCADGSVVSYAFREQDVLDCSGLKDVVALAAGGTHCAFVFRDGSVQVLGDTSLGQGDTAGWQLAVQNG